MIDPKTLKTGDIIWEESYGTVTRGEIDIEVHNASGYSRWGWVHIRCYALPKRKYPSRDNWDNWYCTRKEAIEAASQWLCGKLTTLRAREARLEKMFERISPRTSKWQWHLKSASHRKDDSCKVLATVNSKGNWKIPRLGLKGQETTEAEARAAVDKVLLEWGWELDQW